MDRFQRASIYAPPRVRVSSFATHNTLRLVGCCVRQDGKRASLTALKGFGCWSVHMFMIFSLGRPDILPTGDYGVRKGAMRHFGLSTMPTPAKLEALAAAWAPYRSVASHYMWRKAEE